LATARPVLTADTPAAREALTHRENAWLCNAGDADALAEATAALKADPEHRSDLADAGYRLHQGRGE
jgi:glycosyltransferase involved in cell wall biosynthesis